MKIKKVLPLVSLLFVAIMLLPVGMIAKEYRERRQDIKGFETSVELLDPMAEVQRSTEQEEEKPTDSSTEENAA